VSALKQVLELMELLDGPARGDEVAGLLRARGLEVRVQTVTEGAGSTDFLAIRIPGGSGRSRGGTAPTLGVVGRLGGVGARPHRIGLVSDADGALGALAVALKLADMRARGDELPGDVWVGTHVCPRSPIIPHEPVSFMGSPVAMETMNRMEVDPAMDAILSIDATKGNLVVNRRGIAITPTVKDGWILPVSPDLLEIYSRVTGELPVVLPLSHYDITPYGNGLFHINSILQPATATAQPVVGVAVTAQAAVPGSATGASHPEDVALAATFCVEVAKAFGGGACRFYDPEQYARALGLYGSLAHLRTAGR
jgi:hypothetical protein